MSAGALAAAEPAPALVLCAHGTRGAAGAVRAHAHTLAARGVFPEVHGGALYGTPRVDCVLCGLGPRPVTLVPFMMAAGYTLNTLHQRVRAHPYGAHVHITDPVGIRPEITPMIAEMGVATARAQGWRAGEVALLIVGHGTRKHARSGETARRAATTIDLDGRFAEVATAFLDEPPSVGEAVAALRAPACVAVGFFTDAGDHGQDDVPELLAETGAATAYAGPVGPDARMADVIARQAGA